MSGWRSPLVPIVAVMTVNMFGFGIILPLLPFYAAEFGADPLMIGLLVATYSIFQFVGGPLLGRASDRWGRKPVLIVSQLGTVAGFVVMALANSLWLLFAARAIDGLTGGNIPVAQAAIADVADPKQRAKAFGWFGAAHGIGFIAGPALGGILSVFGYAIPAWFAAGVAFISVLLTIFLLPETRQVAARSVSAVKTGFTRGGALLVLRQGAVVRLLVMLMLYTFAFAVYQTTFALFLDQQFGLNPTQAGLILGYGGILLIFSQLVVLRFAVDWLGEKRLITVGMTVLAVGLLTTALAPMPGLLLVTMVFITFGAAVVKPSADSLIAQQIEDSQRGMVFGVSSSLDALVRIAAPIASGWAIATAGAAASPAAAGVAAIIAAVVSVFLLRGVRSVPRSEAGAAGHGHSQGAAAPGAAHDAAPVRA